MSTHNGQDNPAEEDEAIEPSTAVNRESNECGVREHKLDVEAIIREARRLRRMTEQHPITDEELYEAKRKGRL